MRARFIHITTLLVLALAACSESASTERKVSPAPLAATTAVPPDIEPSGAAPEPALSDAQKATEARVKRRAKAFGAELKGALMAAMQNGGPVEAMRLCSSEAQAMTDNAQGDDVAVGRASLRLRNPKNAPPAWVRTQLEVWGERPAAGTQPIVAHDGRDVRLMVPLAVEPACLTCHGPSDTLVPEVKALLSEHYPDDQATGYSVGDLRGVLWAIGRVEPDPSL